MRALIKKIVEARDLQLFILFSCLGLLGNSNPIALFFGVELIFGSIASLLAIAILGPSWGVLVALIASAYTIQLWNHPFATIILIGEAFFVIFTWMRMQSNLALSSGVYWFIFGIPQVFFCYHIFLAMDVNTSLLAALKQGVNGLVNAILASLFLTYTPLRRLSRLSPRAPITVFQDIFHIFLAAAMMPALALIVIQARGAKGEVEQMVNAQLRTVSSALASSLERWAEQHVDAINYLARTASSQEIDDRDQLQRFLLSGTEVWKDFSRTFITDEYGTAIAFSPTLDKKGVSTLGLNFADRSFFKAAKKNPNEIQISDVYLARGGIFEPVFTVTAAYILNHRFGGIVSGSLDLEKIREILMSPPEPGIYFATLVDASGFVVSANRATVKVMERYAEMERSHVQSLYDGFFQIWPQGQGLNAPMLEWQQSYLGREVLLRGLPGWKLIIEIPLEPHQGLLMDKYNLSMAFMLAIAVLILAASQWVAGRIAEPLTQLTLQTTNLPDRIERNEDILWPRSGLLEVGALVQNFRMAMQLLKKRFQDLELSHVQLAHAKDEAEKANRSKSAFLANISHEIRTPLGVIMGFSDLLLAKNTSEREKQKYILKIKRNSEQLSVLVNDILDLSKVESGHLQLEIIPLSLRGLIDELRSDFAQKAALRGLWLKCEISNGTPDRLITDPLRLKQILWNLLGNAVKFTQSGGVMISVLRCDERLEIEVKDTGIGIALVDQKKLFRIFTQADESMTRKYGGTGLGLVLSKRLCQLLGGDLSLKESSPGRGSTFAFHIKNHIADEFVESQPTEAYRKDFEQPAITDLNGVKVLLVEDSEDNQFYISQILKGKGAEVEVAVNGSEAVAKALKGVHDLVIMDLQMPIMDGYTATQLLRDNNYDRPIVALTAHAMSEVRDKCLEAGCTDFLTKPVDPRALLSTVARLSQHHPI